MKKSKKLLSVLCAVCMILAMAVPAFAAETTLSANAGKDIIVDTIWVKPDGEIARFTSTVSIPENATPAQEDALTSQAALAVTGINSSNLTRSMLRSGSQNLGSGTEQYLPAALPSETSRLIIGSGTLEQDSSYLQVKFSNADDAIGQLNIRLENSYWTVGSPNLNCYTKETNISSRGDCTIIMYDGTKYGLNNTASCRLKDGDYIKVYASADVAGYVDYTTDVYF